ncbi:HlyD family secretion protein [Gloeocapsa sp. PCC 73106]|uniref:HlyD family secretion protein n=1 Tax=Gloeocapsa sp. PCC 73106 TaxID=102232 RepID=UPI0002ABD869|nr:HlyD family efflux transporter periplasmic adaptor subunit [Gloeocapsa sp. PCC 73106]ELR97093.1 multidrug resistance efflux pump [Gloeocapsa sp. PCC 73106]
MINKENKILRLPGDLVAQFTGNSVSQKPLGLKAKATLLSLIAISAILSGVGYLVWRQQYPVVKNEVNLSGRIEGYETEIGVNRSGRIESIEVREGAVVKQGQVLVYLDDSEDQILQSQLRSAEAQITSAESEKEQAQAEVERIKARTQQIENQIGEAELNLQQSQGDSQGRIGAAQSQVAVAQAQMIQAQAQVEQAQAVLKLAQINRDRYGNLLGQGVISQQELDNAQTELDTALAVLKTREAEANAAWQQLQVAQSSLQQAQSSEFNPEIRQSQKEAQIKEKEQNKAQLLAAQAKVKAASAKIKDAQSQKEQVLTQIAEAKKDLQVVSPIDGVVVARNFEPGTVVSNQSKILTIIDPQTVYLRGFVAAEDVGKLRLGQLVQVWIDGAPDHPLIGELISIDPQASFTPENIYFAKDRVQQVFGLRISIENPPGCFTPAQTQEGTELPCARIGMPADATIKLQ